MSNSKYVGKNANKDFVDIDKQRLMLYLTGRNDTEISKALGVTVDCITKWRDSHGLPRNKPVIDERLQMYKKGFTDSDIARVERCSSRRITAWRRLHKLPVNEPHKSLKQIALEDKHKRFKLLDERGYSDNEIRKKCHCHLATVTKWREGKNESA